MSSMSPEDQWRLINTPQADDAVFNKVRNVLLAMQEAEVEIDDWIRTRIQGVPIRFREEGDYVNIEVGINSDNTPLIPMRIPAIWLEG